MDALRETKLHDISRIVSKLDCVRLRFLEYRQAGGRFSKEQIYSDGDTWGKLCAELNIQVKRKNIPVPNEVYFERLKVFIAQHGRTPKASEKKKAGLNFRKSRWSTLSAFLRDAREKQITPGYLVPTTKDFAATADSYLECLLPQNEDHPNIPVVVRKSDIRPVPPIPFLTKRRHPSWKRIDIGGFPYRSWRGGFICHSM
ncbi:MAG TPA: hypothetical protein VJ692_13715 [Nitrospiraceae bacterium]|nr:hypothetical protein [Nitrospiraceae bacterium]